MAFTGPQSDRLAIRELYEGYADGAARIDRDAWLAAYAEDAQSRSPFFDIAGLPAIGTMFDQLMADVISVTIGIRLGALEIEGDEATARLYQTESLLYPDGSTWELTGHYEDILERRAGRWWLVDRTYLLERETRPDPPGALFAGPAAERMAIRELMEAYADASSRMDKQQWLNCWSDDCVWHTSTGEVAGKAALSERWDQIAESMTALAFFAMPGTIRVTGDTATASCHVREIARILGQVRKFSARYDDELVKREGRWLFRRRTYVMNIAE
ncbi:nuclear transport factor 2 family protein [Novosphingobium album (ex Hu et al. 2023)]|uniref:Nuclear transport factor 2 family protein n=1 Tax=Novosphingobium album (ex Hu et al. 2023) TaxID=2930093 RepID=A0ABT0AZM5_9SPHN|nr:nuclear transport factor 2 family protein [Novosphingobium album (ex Hu et al. 2023)]MCJ2178251.1 nuclear transport factor 2 family protein [Novosphingobium album (ex Hu et al. 2023)]